MNIEVNAELVIQNLLEQNKQLTLEVAILKAQLDKNVETSSIEEE